MKTEFIAKNCIAHAEEYSFNEGCLPDTAKTQFFNTQFKAHSLSELVNQIRQYYRARRDEITLDACEEKGRLDIQILNKKRFNFSRSSERTLLAWRAGLINLYLHNISFYVREIRTEFSLSKALK